MTVQEAEKKVRNKDALEYCKKQSMLEQMVGNETWRHYYYASKALEEVEQYRALGTPKEIKIREVSSAQLGKAYLSNLTELREYQSLGTVEELKEAMEFKKYFDELYGEGLEVANWHKNGDLEPFDSFYESALDWEEEDD